MITKMVEATTNTNTIDVSINQKKIEVIDSAKSSLSTLKNTVDTNKIPTTTKNIETQEYKWETIVKFSVPQLKEKYPENWMEILRGGVKYEINKVRREENIKRKKTKKPLLPMVTLNEPLNQACQGHSEDMALNTYEGHYNLDGKNRDDRVEQVGYDALLVTENILSSTLGLLSIRGIINSWYQSVGHKQNLLCKYNNDTQYFPSDHCSTEIGVGYAENGGKEYWTLLLCRPF